VDYLVGVIIIGLPFFFGIESAPLLALEHRVQRAGRRSRPAVHGA
jgi:hypothetical protein